MIDLDRAILLALALLLSTTQVAFAADTAANNDDRPSARAKATPDPATVMLHAGGEVRPDYRFALTPQQLMAAWNAEIERVFVKTPNTK